jgi:Kdo2-lipid IVA lauroyltransferase/acyltransferase
MAALVYYLFVYPLSKLPLGIIYLISDFFYLLLISVFPYRKNVINSNLQRSFPHKSKYEINKLRKKFYRHFSDLLAEGIKNLSISSSELKKRITLVNPEVMERLYEQKKSVLLVSGHYNNWEWMITGQQLFFKHKAVGIGMPLSSKFWDKKINALRARFGMKIIHSKIVKDSFDALNKECIATLILSDQSPGDSNKAFWTSFLNQKTAVLFGCEQLAHTYNHAVVFFHLEKVNRGYYKLHLQEITSNPRELNWGDITQKHTQLLEKIIEEKPEFWLWSHKRWKREMPENMIELIAFQKEKFNLKFK